MYMRDFWKRVNFTDICGFILTGQEHCGSDSTGTPGEREARYTKEFYNGLRGFRDRVAEHDWSRYDTENRKTMASEKMWTEVVEASGDLSDLYFEMGIQAGLQLGREMQNNMSMTAIESEETYVSNEEHVRKIDELGRVVIPGELRKALDWKERDELTIKQCGPTQIILEKAYPTCFVCGARETLTEIGPVKICASCRSLLIDANDGDIIKVEPKEEPAE